MSSGKLFQTFRPATFRYAVPIGRLLTSAHRQKIISGHIRGWHDRAKDIWPRADENPVCELEKGLRGTPPYATLQKIFEFLTSKWCISVDSADEYLICLFHN